MGTPELQWIIEEGGLESAIRWYRNVKEKHWKVYRYYFHEGLIDQLAFDLLNKNKMKEAIDIFKFNTCVFPGSADVWEHLGDAYKRTGNHRQATANYEKSLQVNPLNTNAKEKLKKLNRK